MSNLYCRMTKCKTSAGGVGGRYDYLTNPARQEKILADYSTDGPEVWAMLSKQTKQSFAKYGSSGSCTEARELTIALPEHYLNANDRAYSDIAQNLADDFKKQYGVPCTVAIHSKGGGKNIHAHLLFSEMQLLDKPEIKVAPRRQFYDENGKKQRTKSAVLDENGNLKQGCKIIEKGEVVEERYFAAKDNRFKDTDYLNKIKTDMAKKIDLSVYDKTKAFLKTIKYGKGNPKADSIKKYNHAVYDYNKAVSTALKLGVEKEALQQTKIDIYSLPVNERFISILEIAKDIKREIHLRKEKAAQNEKFDDTGRSLSGSYTPDEKKYIIEPELSFVAEKDNQMDITIPKKKKDDDMPSINDIDYPEPDSYIPFNNSIDKGRGR